GQHHVPGVGGPEVGDGDRVGDVAAGVHRVGAVRLGQLHVGQGVDGGDRRDGVVGEVGVHRAGGDRGRVADRAARGHVRVDAHRHVEGGGGAGGEGGGSGGDGAAGRRGGQRERRPARLGRRHEGGAGRDGVAERDVERRVRAGVGQRDGVGDVLPGD